MDELFEASIMNIIVKADEKHFIYIFYDGVKASFDLTKTGYRVFHIVLQDYQFSKMKIGYNDTITVFFLRDERMVLLLICLKNLCKLT